MAEILASLGGLDADWLHDALEEAGHSPPAIAALTTSPMDGFVGALGEVGVVEVDWAEPTHLPAEFIVKCPLDSDVARMYASVMLSYQREAGFYRTMTDRVGLHLARCYVNLFDPETHHATLVLERVDGEKGDLLTGTTFDRLHRLVGDLAHMHGRFWMDDQLTELDWLVDWAEPALRAGIPITLENWERWPVLGLDWYPADLHDHLEANFIADIEANLETFAGRPWTFVHMDYELDNVVFRDGEPVILDWQTAMRSFPGLDLSWTLACSHTDQTLAREPELLDHYRAELAAAGGPEWSADELLDDLAWGAYYWASVGKTPVVDTMEAGPADRGFQRFCRMLQGSIAGAVRWGVTERVPG